MRKLLLLTATLGALAMISQPASAHGYGPAYPAPALGVHIILRQAPGAVRHYHDQRHYQPRHFYPVPVRHYGHRPQRGTWHGPWHAGPRHFRHDDQRGWRGGDLRHDGHREWNRGPRQHDFGHGHRRH
jgi:hypothetical protein